MAGTTLAYVADRNEVQNPSTDNPCTVTSNVPWTATSPLSNILTTPLSNRAICTQLGTGHPVTGAPIAPVVIELAWVNPILLTHAGLYDTNLRQDAYFRMEGFLDGELVATTVVDGLDLNVVPSLTDPEDMPAGAPNQMRGDLDPRDIALLPTNLRAIVPLVPVTVIRWTLWGGAYRPDGSDDTGYRVGMAWAGDGLTFSRHVGASGEGVKDNDDVIAGAGGSVWVEPGIVKRTITIDRGVNDRKLRNELFKMALRTGKRKPLVYIPNIADAAENTLYGGLYRRANDHSQVYVSPRHTNYRGEMEEFKE
ncbi:hypothetical protein AZL_020460 [Azospirillum sp. B510]|uniref:hypothetical protein n=1 Tax=Azospirillum sp. (strain B510) TaxID=137722 RepID=UPI0001C4C352|nr:hypothetical protein [Azospirillum sp. B510]BAI71467.1 hypothetical protein AZL_008290 [Azospirillum sp. B510]BAI72684.1 hypothetical protein AZL_020460 [Azospirillum sp. B510]